LANTITADTGVTFTNGGSTVGYYLTGFSGFTFTANTGNPATVESNVVYTRIGNIVTITIAATTFTATGSPQYYTASAVVPATLRPTNGQVQAIFAPKIGVSTYEASNMGSVVINSSG